MFPHQLIRLNALNFIFRDREFYGWRGVGRETKIIITNKLHTRLWRI